MKKICFVNYDMTVTGGVEQVTTTLANEFCKEYEVYIYAIFGKGGHVPYDLDPRITYRAELEEECRIRDRIKKTFRPFRDFVRQNQIDVVFLMENYPAMTVSILSSRSACVTYLRFSLTARSAASFTIFASSAPDAPDAALAIALKSMSSPSLTFFA